jgi:hypothetical protein
MNAALVPHKGKSSFKVTSRSHAGQETRVIKHVKEMV